MQNLQNPIILIHALFIHFDARYKEKERSFTDISFQIYHDMFIIYVYIVKTTV